MEEDNFKSESQINKLIIQIGRLDRFYLNEIEFSFNEERGTSNLSSSFLVNTQYFKDANRLIIYPVSLIFQDNLLSIKDDPFITKMDEVDIGSYLEKPQNLFKKHPQSNGNDFIVVSSQGQYHFKGVEHVFKGNLDIITLQTYLHLVSNYSIESLEEIYVDISSGQNIYLSALMNALYRFIPFIRFKRLLYLDNKKVAGWILNSDPIVGTPTHTISIHKSKFGAKAFNALTFKEFENLRPIVKHIFKGKDYYQDILSLLESEYLLLHSALIRGTPLLLTSVNEKTLSSLFKTTGLQTIALDLNNYYKVGHDDVIGEDDANLIYLITFSLAITQSIYFHFEKIISKKEMEFSIEDDQSGSPSIKNTTLDTAFRLLSEDFSQPEPNYKDEIIKMIKLYRNKERQTFVAFVDLVKEANPTYSANPEFNPRNYFAHGGMELNVTEIKVDDNIVSVRYNFGLEDKKRKSIIKYLKK